MFQTPLPTAAAALSLQTFLGSLTADAVSGCSEGPRSEQCSARGKKQRAAAVKPGGHFAARGYSRRGWGTLPRQGAGPAGCPAPEDSGAAGATSSGDRPGSGDETPRAPHRTPRAARGATRSERGTGVEVWPVRLWAGPRRERPRGGAGAGEAEPQARGAAGSVGCRTLAVCVQRAAAMLNCWEAALGAAVSVPVFLFVAAPYIRCVLPSAAPALRLCSAPRSGGC